jgi:hypothetical protein
MREALILAFVEHHLSLIVMGDVPAKSRLQGSTTNSISTLGILPSIVWHVSIASVRVTPLSPYTVDVNMSKLIRNFVG